ncbi:MAG: extra-cytoplasmic solute receptor family protein [Hyphomicrobiales bacterium]|nr:extra-cytoplasmic solute receptor family protein [Hyphomicrobiales bacterium]
MGAMRLRTQLAFGLACLLGAAPASAQDAEKQFFHGKTVRLVVGSGTGGGYDIYARLIAPYLTRALDATVVVENQPGAGGISSLNRLYVATPDGLTMSFANGTSAAFAQITEQPGLRFDLAKFDYLATVGAPPGIWLVGPESPFRTVKDIASAGRKLQWGASGPSDGLGNGAAFACTALKLDCQIVAGYTGSNQAALAVTKGEMDAVYIPESSANNFVKAGQLVALATMARKKSRWFQDKPTIHEAMPLDADAQWLFDFHSGVEDLGRVMILPPGMPKARLAYLQGVVKEVLHNPQLIADGERSERIIEYLDPESTLQNALKVVAQVTPEQKARVQKIVSREK